MNSLLSWCGLLCSGFVRSACCICIIPHQNPPHKGQKPCSMQLFPKRKRERFLWRRIVPFAKLFDAMSFALLLLPLCILHCRGRRPRRSGYVPAACCSRRPGGSAALPLAMGVLPAVFAGADPITRLNARRKDWMLLYPSRSGRSETLQPSCSRTQAALTRSCSRYSAKLVPVSFLKMADRYPSDRLNSALTMARPRFGLW